jgi:hypothetical protein
MSSYWPLRSVQRKAAKPVSPSPKATGGTTRNRDWDRDRVVVFTSLVQLRAGGLVIGVDPFFTSRNEQLGALTARHAVPTIHQGREFTAAGGLMSYGGSVA